VSASFPTQPPLVSAPRHPDPDVRESYAICFFAILALTAVNVALPPTVQEEVVIISFCPVTALISAGQTCAGRK